MIFHSTFLNFKDILNFERLKINSGLTIAKYLKIFSFPETEFNFNFFQISAFQSDRTISEYRS